MSSATTRSTPSPANATLDLDSLEPGPRRVGRPRHYADDVERELIMAAGYESLRDHGADLTLTLILAKAGVSTRSFYRQFESKDALLCAMYRRDAEYVAGRLAARTAAASSPAEAVEAWIDEIFGFVRSPRRAERVSVLGSIQAHRAEGAEQETAHALQLLVAPLRAAIAQGVDAGQFAALDAHTAAELMTVAVLHASGVSPQVGSRPGSRTGNQAEVTAFCLRALGAR